MTTTLELPNEETVTPDDVFLYGGYPYRFVPREEGFLFRPLYWGGGDMDVPFRDREALVEQWGPESEGLMTDAGWRDWLASARGDDRFGAEELDAIEQEVLGEGNTGLVTRMQRLLGL